MKAKLFIPLILAAILSINCFAQEDKYKQFHDYLLEQCKPAKSVLAQCGWQYAMVRLVTDKTGKVIGYILLNQTSDSLKLAYKPLIGFQFPAALKMQNKEFVFAQTFYNLQGKCSPADSPDIDNVFNETYQCFIRQLLLNPKTIFDPFIFGSGSMEEKTIDSRNFGPPVVPLKVIPLH